MAEYPHHSIPDGHVLAPHHVYLGALVVLLVVWMVSDDRPGREAWVVASSVLVALVAFLLTWRWYPTVGASLSLLGLLVALTAVVGRPFWWQYRLVGLRGLALVGVLVALDDVIEHALGWSTPLDLFWQRWLFPLVEWIEAL